MSNRFVKVYNDNEPSGYISTKDIFHFDVERIEDPYGSECSYFIVKACEAKEQLEDGYTVSPLMGSMEEAYLFLDSIIEKLR